MSTAEWKPLEQFAENVHRKGPVYCTPAILQGFCSRFMFMGCSDSGAQTYYLYKEINTRKYLNLTADSMPHAFIHGSGYTPITAEEALCHIGETF